MLSAKFIIEHTYQVDTTHPGIIRFVRLFRVVVDDVVSVDDCVNAIHDIMKRYTYPLPEFDASEFAMGIVVHYKTGPGMVHYVSEDTFKKVDTDISVLIVHNMDTDIHLDLTIFSPKSGLQREFRMTQESIVDLDTSQTVSPP